MAQLLVRKVSADLVRSLKQRARAHGISAEEEHRRILAAGLLGTARTKPFLADFLLSEPVLPDVELDLSRSREIENRDTGF